MCESVKKLNKDFTAQTDREIKPEKTEKENHQG
jgi:hypothetical protein